MADNYGAEVPENVTRDELEDLVEEAAEEWYREHRETNNHSVRIEETKYDIQAADRPEQWAEDEIELPESYNETRIVLLLRDPGWAFAYWDLRNTDRHEFQRSDTFEGLLLRVFTLPRSDARIDEARDRFDIPITLLDERWYINLPEQETCYRLELVALIDEGERRLATSNVIYAPRGMMADARDESDVGIGDRIIAQTGIHDLDLPAPGKRIPQRILDLIDEELLFN